jgi:acetyl-CoA synthetase
VEQAHIPDYQAVYERSIADPEAFWAERAETLEWYRKWDQVLDDSNAPFYKWFVGGNTNIALNAVDRHVKTWRRNKLAIIWEGENGEKRTYSYWRLYQRGEQVRQRLAEHGRAQGDTVTILHGTHPEIVIAMLACAKIGAPHSGGLWWL